MARRVKVLGVFLAWVWLAGCFSGGEVVDERGSDEGLEPDDAAVAFDGGRDVAEGPADSNPGGCEQGAIECDDACVDTRSSIAHCGGCGNRCESSGVNVEPVCADGVCAQACAAGWSDDDDDLENGCELECAPSNDGVEICDGVDNDCSGVVDDGFSTGACTVGTGGCEASGQFVCVDSDNAACDASPKTPVDEVCADGIDNDCDGEVDEGDAVDARSWFLDADGDGFGDRAASSTACEKPQDHVANDTDCDDTDASVHTSVDGYADQDADGFTAGGVQTLCTDGALPAGFKSSQNGQDCDDADAATHPNADEVCGDQIDNDCDGSADDASAVDAPTWYIDCDGDGYSADTSGSRVACEKPTSSTGCMVSGSDWTQTRPGGSNTDCNDDEADAYPGQTDWFSTAMIGANFNDKWDFNCDGIVGRQYTMTDATCSSCDWGAGERAGWTGSFELSCGQSGSFQNCYIDLLTRACNSALVTNTQACR